MNAHDVLKIYQEMVDVEERMFSAVQVEDWDNFIKLSELVVEKTAALQEGDVGIPMNDEETIEKKELIEKFLNIDRQVKITVQLKMAELAKMINSTAMKDKVHQRYGSLRTQ